MYRYIILILYICIYMFYHLYMKITELEKMGGECGYWSALSLFTWTVVVPCTSCSSLLLKFLILSVYHTVATIEVYLSLFQRCDHERKVYQCLSIGYDYDLT